MKIATKLILGFLSVALLVGFVGFFGVNVMTKVGSQFERVAQETIPVIEALEDIKFSGLRIVASTSEFGLIQAEKREAGGRGGEKQEKVFLESGRQLFLDSLKKYEGLVDRYFPDERENLEGIRATGKKLQELSASLIALIEKGVSGELILEAKEDFEKSEKAFLQAVNLALEKEASEFTKRKEEVGSSIANSIKLMLIVGVVTFLVAIGLGIIVARSIAIPLSRLRSATVTMSQGDLTIRSDVKSKDEVGELALSFNHMADSIQNKNEELQTFNEELQTTNEELKSTSEELEATNEELKASNEEIRETQEKMLRQEKLAAVGQLASGIGHELRNPLGVMKNAVYFLKTKLGLEDEKIAKHLKIMEKEIDSSTKIISDLLGFSKTQKPTVAPNDINRAVEEALAAVAEVPPNVRISKNLGPKLPQALFDPDQIRQVFLNLILNAIQAMNDGGGMLSVTTRLANDTVEVEFKDSGTGIPQENLKKLFDPFFTTKSRGVGLGLAVSHGIIERHQGKLSVDSVVAQGTTMTVTLPIS